MKHLDAGCFLVSSNRQFLFGFPVVFYLKFERSTGTFLILMIQGQLGKVRLTFKVFKSRMMDTSSKLIFEK